MHRSSTQHGPFAQRKPTRAVIAGVSAFVGIFTLFLLAGLSQTGRLKQYERSAALLGASTVRVAIEGSLNEHINLERGIVAFVASNPGLDAEAYARYARALVMDDPIIINLAVLEGTVVKFVYPYEPNVNAIGKDLAAVPDQAAAIVRAMSTRNPIVSGPHELVQGGYGVISRMGIFPTGPSGPEYWGQASVVVDINEILRRSGVADHDSLAFMLRSNAERDSVAVPIFGDRSILGQDPVILDIRLPGATWTLAAAPEGGWKTFGWLAFGIAWIGALIGILSGFALYSLITTRGALKELAYHDQLTNLPNRTLFWDRLHVEAVRAERDGQRVCVCMVDLDDFKAVNDDLGHESGDRLLEQAAARMGAALRKSDTVARLGGDEFAVIAQVDAPSGVDEVTARIKGCFVEPFDLGSVKRASSASIGGALYPDDGTDVEAVLAIADHRMYARKHAAR